MRINADFSVPVFLRTSEMDWVASPTPGVERRMLDRIGDEVARATSIVRYAPNSEFPCHVHGGGEEILVLDGVFTDEHGSYPAGTYLRNPPGTSHAPGSPDGCILFVKLWQFAGDDGAQRVVDTGRARWQSTEWRGVERLPLHQHGSEDVALYRMTPGSVMPADFRDGGGEMLILDGGLGDGVRDYVAGDWLRLPPGSRLEWHAPDGVRFYLKTGHLRPGADD